MWCKNKFYIAAIAALVVIIVVGFNKTNHHNQNKPEVAKIFQPENSSSKEDLQKDGSSNKNNNKPPQKFTAEINFRKTTLTALHGSERAWDLDAAKVQMDEKTNKAVAFKVTGVFYAEKEPRATVVSSGADIDMNTKDILFHGEVQITTNRGEKAWSRFMRWDGKRQRLIGWDGVKLWKNDSIIFGTTLEADPSFKELSVKGNVNSVF